MDTRSAQQESQAVKMRVLPAVRPLDWLGRGAADLWRCPLPGLLHGLVVAAFGALLLWWARDRFWLLAGAFSGFLLMAPLVVTGLYAISRALEQGQRPSLGTALAAWGPGHRPLVVFGLLLALAGTGWVLTSAALITGFAPAPVRNPSDFVRVVLLGTDHWLFEAWMLLGGLMAAPVFASSVISIPLLLDRRISVLAAVLTSWRVVAAHPVAMSLWAVCLIGLTLAGMLPFLLGLVVVAPLTAHASWHAYRDLVDASALPARR
jgi:uncharacterized membrane protein